MTTPPSWPGAALQNSRHPRESADPEPALAKARGQVRMVPFAAVHLGPGFRRDDA